MQNEEHKNVKWLDSYQFKHGRFHVFPITVGSFEASCRWCWVDVFVHSAKVRETRTLKVYLAVQNIAMLGCTGFFLLLLLLRPLKLPSHKVHRTTRVRFSTLNFVGTTRDGTIPRTTRLWAFTPPGGTPGGTGGSSKKMQAWPVRTR